MEKRDRKLRGARLTMLLAAFLAAGASFGLHPEPGGGPGASPVLECAHSPAAAPEAHDCLACRAHRSVVVARASSALSVPIVRPASCLVSRSDLPRPGEPSRRDGRAPPATS